MSKDLFDDSTMSFGEHLEILRYHLIKALLGLVIGIVIALFFSNYVIYAMQIPLENALQKYYGIKLETKAGESISEFSWWSYVTGKPKPDAPPEGTKPPAAASDGAAEKTIENTAAAPLEKTSEKPAATAEKPPEQAPQVAGQIDATQLMAALHKLNPQYPAPAAGTPPHLVDFFLPAAAIQQVASNPSLMDIATTFTPEEAFMIYIKVAMAAGLVLSSPWVFYQLWMFVAAGLYPHERKYIYIYLPMSLFLFIGGALFCFYAVIPYVLDFLFSFNAWLHLRPQVRITEWISFAVILPVMFGASFQLPLVMLLLERISIFEVQAYRDQRRMAILVISIVSMVLTPSDPISMMLMMVPLCVLYEFGILLCASYHPKSPFEAKAA
jgi:sec-independent protein translocase protein TatC